MLLCVVNVQGRSSSSSHGRNETRRKTVIKCTIVTAVVPVLPNSYGTEKDSSLQENQRLL